jgi:hypothetical protein
MRERGSEREREKREREREKKERERETNLPSGSFKRSSTRAKTES